MKGLTSAKVARAFAVAGPTILLFLISLFAGLPLSLGLPLAARVIGGVIAVAGLAMAAWVFAYRSPADMIVSTYVTLTKLVRRTPIAEPSGRTEPLVVRGPQKYVKNPLYFAVEIVVFGWALTASSTYVLVATVALLLWYALVLIPFEERELRALFGEHFEKYVEEVPMLVPFTKRKKRSASQASS